MREEFIIELLTELIKTAMLLTAPAIIGVVIVGITMNVLQTITQVKDQTILFVPKVVVACVILIIGAPWYLEHMNAFFHKIMELISQGGM